MAKVVALCISKHKGTVKNEVPTIEVVTNHGFLNDAHAGNWHRQVSLISLKEIIDEQKEYPSKEYGAYAENILVDDLNLSSLPIGSQIYINNVILEVSQIGKECHNGCNIKKITGKCVMPRFGIFCKVIQGGIINKNDEIKVVINERFIKNSLTIPYDKKVMIVGVGALGQVVANNLIRSGLHNLILVDFDKINYSNFNRQIFADEKSLGKDKVEIVKEQLLLINNNVNIEIRKEHYSSKKTDDIDLIIDCVDNDESRRKIANSKNYIISGAVNDYEGQVIVSSDGQFLDSIYHKKSTPIKFNNIHTVNIVASIMSKEAVKYLCKIKSNLVNKIMYINVLNDEYQILG